MNITTENAMELAGKVLSHMLAPDHVREEGGPCFMTNENGELALEMRLRWHCARNLAFGDPSRFIYDLQRILSPISTAITFGEVCELREEVKRKDVRMKDLERRVEELIRYKDAWALQSSREIR